MYCGNNALKQNVIFGTNYQCLQKGIGIGLSLPYDNSYNEPYEPIDKTKLYCGNLRALPNGYNRKGTPPECLRKGVGIGKKIKSRKASRKGKSKRGASKKRKASKKKRKASKKKRKASKKKRKASKKKRKASKKKRKPTKKSRKP